MSFNDPAINRLAEFLGVPAASASIEQLTPDASVREFFRIEWEPKGTAIVCAYPEAITEALPQIDVTDLFRANDLPVAEIYHVEPTLGFLVHEDFGDRILYSDESFAKNRDQYIDQAIGLIARIQSATDDSYKRESISSKLKFDEFKLGWELQFFKKHYFSSLQQKELTADFDTGLDQEFKTLALLLESHAQVLNHRDFHAANLMLVGEELRIIDHQDARIGATSYDLVSLLLDRIVELPTEESLAEKKALLGTELAKFGMTLKDSFEREFDLVTIQRCLKAIGTFANQAANHDKRGYLQYVKPMFGVVSRAARKVGEFPLIKEMAEAESVIEKSTGSFES